MKFKILDKYDTEGIEIKDIALKPYISVDGKLLIKSHGRSTGKFSSAKVNIIERVVRRIGVPGHVGKKHRRITSWGASQFANNMKIMIEALEMIESKKKENPVQVLVRAIENSAPRDETTTIEYGGARYPQAVDVSPSRRINLAIRWMVQGSYQKSAGKKKKMSETLANEIMLASDGNMESYALSKKNEAEKQADAAR